MTGLRGFDDPKPWELWLDGEKHSEHATIAEVHAAIDALSLDMVWDEGSEYEGTGYCCSGRAVRVGIIHKHGWQSDVDAPKGG
jgi:hypothetical protein